MQEREFAVLWKQYEPLIKAIVELLQPFVEAAVHDLEQGKIVAIYHNISHRKVGETSPLKELKIEIKDFPDYFSPYYKTNWDGRALKCTSITMRNKKGDPIGLICLNVDVSAFQESQKIIESFLKITKDASNPIEMFGNGCEEQARPIIQQYLDDNRMTLNRLNRAQKRELVQQLYRKGIFNFKNAAPFIAQKLNTSRASIYNYIKQIPRNKIEHETAYFTVCC